MAPERAREVERICQAALERPASERAGFLGDACAGDEQLRRDVERLLAHDDAASTFLETPAVAMAARSMARTDDTFEPGKRFGPYTIVSRLGAGGMGEVYRGRDTTLGREVALKVLPTLLTSDTEMLARFEREARVLAALNHPNIATIYGIEHVDGVHALILEVIEGPTLAGRLQRTRLSLTEALGLARQIAVALEAAHENGIVHRDLKPANIKIRPDGVVKVLDFGLATVVTSADGRVSDRAVSDPPTMSLDRSHVGTVLGTAAYMSPEQARGERVDRRADIWAFGVVLYEMLTGRAGFDGATTVEVLSNVLKTEPDWTALPSDTPPAIRSLLRRMLQKDAARRQRDIADARFQIEEALSEPAPVSAATRPTAKAANRTLMWIAILVGVAAAAGLLLWKSPRRAEPAEVRLDLVTPPTTETTSLAVSPDGSQVVFVASEQGQSRLWLRPLDSASARSLAGTENAKSPFWSPDGRSIGFAANDQLKRVDIESGAVRIVASGGAVGGAWNRDGTILYKRRSGGGLFLVSADGGDPRPATQTTVEAGNHQYPQFLPDHRRVLFYSTGAKPGIYLGELGSPDAVQWLLDADAAIYGAASGHLLFVKNGTLFAQRFDPDRLTLSGSAVTVAERIASREGTAGLSVSAAGPIVYRSGPSREQHQFVWFDRSGNRLATVPGSDFSNSFSAALSHDERRLAMERVVGTADLWALDVRRGVPERLTTDPLYDLTPVWSPDDRMIAFTSNRLGPSRWALYVRPADSTGEDQLIVETGAVAAPTDWSPDGRVILYGHATNPGPRDIWAAPLHGDRKPFPVVATPFNETSAQFSPDGRWIAYQSDASGSMEIYVQRYPTGRRVRVSLDGGVQVRWHSDGVELFYLAPDNRLMAVPVRMDVNSEIIDAGQAVSLFTAPVAGQPSQPSGRHYMVSRDGQRFLMDTLVEMEFPMTVLLNWKPRP